MSSCVLCLNDESLVNRTLYSRSAPCSNDYIQKLGKLVPASTIAGVFQNGVGIACLQNSTASSCLVESQGWQGADVIRWDPSSCDTGNATYDNPMCFQGNFSLTQVLPAQQRMSTLYAKSTLCSQCFLKMFYQRLSSPYLPDTDFSDYLVGQFSDMQSVCSTSMALTTRALPTYANATAFPSPTTSTTSAPAVSTTCAGQTIQPSSTPQTCDQLSKQYGVTTGDLIAITQDYNCGFTSPICVPLNCTLDWIPTYGQSCDTLRANYSTASNTNITLGQFQNWNPNILGFCDGVQARQYICKGAPGGIFVAPSSSIAAPTASSAYYSTASASEPTSSGTTSKCGHYYDVQAGDDCSSVTLNSGITFPQLLQLNTQLYTNCSNLWLGYAYCVANVTQAPISSDGTCGPNNAQQATCTGSQFGSCCSTSGYCGSTSAYCGSGNCYSGACTAPPTNATSTDGTCGPAHNYTICPSTYCCSTSGYCGNTTAYCGPGNCYSGNCAPNTGGPSTDGTCGPQFAGNKTCTGTQFGVCCSTSGYCGNSSAYCGAGNCYSGACTSASKRSLPIILSDEVWSNIKSGVV